MPSIFTYQRTFYFFVLLVLGYYSYYPLCPDNEWLIYSAQSMLNGSEIYKEVMETNPPLIIILTSIPVYFSNVTSIPTHYTFLFFIFILIAISLHLILQILKSVQFTDSKTLKYLYIGLSAILLIIPAWDFGEREHLMIIFILPYIILMMFRDKIKNSNSLLVYISLFAIFGFNLKPYFYFIFVSIEIAYLLYTRKVLALWRIESIIIGSSGFIYLGLIFLFFPAYITTLLPIAIKSYTVFLQKDFMLLIRMNEDIILGGIVWGYLVYLFVKTKKLDILVLNAAMLGAIILYFYQQKGWHYHILPFLIVSLFSLLYSVVCYTEKKLRIVSIILLPLIITIFEVNLYRSYYPKLEIYINSLPTKSKIVAYSIDLAMGQPLLQKEQIWTSRFQALWMLPAILKLKDAELKAYMFNAIYDDLVRFRPDYLIFSSQQGGFSYLNYFEKSDARVAHILESQYVATQHETFTVLTKTTQKLYK